MDNKMKCAFKSTVVAVVAGSAVAVLLAAPANASSVTLTFGDLRNGAAITNWFNGGPNPFPPPVAHGPQDGVIFSANANEQKKGVTGTGGQGTGKFENNPSGATGVLYFPFSASGKSYLNDASGFNNVELDYSLLNNSYSFEGASPTSETVELFSGLNGTGTLLGSITLEPNATTVACKTRGDEFCTWSSAILKTTPGQLAESIFFGPAGTGPLIGIEFDSVRLSQTPLPAALPLFGSGLALIGLFGRRRRNATK
jgi:hypothetical protein